MVEVDLLPGKSVTHNGILKLLKPELKFDDGDLITATVLKNLEVELKKNQVFLLLRQVFMTPKLLRATGLLHFYCL